MSKPEDFILVLCYANWCGHCKNFYLKKDDNPLSIDEAKKLDTLSWQKVKNECGIKATQFEEGELSGKVNIEEKKQDKVNVENFDLKDLATHVKGWPTILILKKDNSGKYVYHETYEGGREKIEQFKKFIEQCKAGKKMEGGKKRKAGSKKGSRKGSRKIQDGGKRRSRKTGSKKGSRKGSRKIQDGGKRRSRKTASKKTSKKSGKRN